MTTQEQSPGFNLRAEGKRVLQGSSGGRTERKHNPVEKAKGEYDVVVIGAGLAGPIAHYLNNLLDERLGCLERCEQSVNELVSRAEL